MKIVKTCDLCATINVVKEVSEEWFCSKCKQTYGLLDCDIGIILSDDQVRVLNLLRKHDLSADDIDLFGRWYNGREPGMFG